MADNWMVPFIETVASQDDPTSVAKDFVFDPFSFAQTAADAQFLETINSLKDKGEFHVVVTLKRLFTFSAVLVMNDDDHMIFVVDHHSVATLQFLLDHHAPAPWVEVTLLKPKTRELLMKLQFVNVLITESRRFMRYMVFRAELDHWYTLVQNISEL